MSQSAALVQTLKQALKAHGKTYVDVAEALDLSEASVKRLFAQNSFSLERLEQACQLIGLELSNLFQLMNETQPQLKQLTMEQEKEITQDISLLMVTVCVLNRWSMAEMIEFYDFTEHEVMQKLAHLDRLKLIELLPKNRIKLLVSPNFRWINRGPIQQFFQQSIAHEFFNTRFDRPDECLMVMTGMLSPKSNAEFQRKLQRLAREFNLINNEDAVLPLKQREGVTVVLAMRDWRYGLFQPLQKNAKSQ